MRLSTTLGRRKPFLSQASARRTSGHMRDAASSISNSLDGATARPRWFVHFWMLVLYMTNEIALVPKDISTTVC